MSGDYRRIRTDYRRSCAESHPNGTSLKSESGLSLLELLMAMFVGTAIALGFATTIANNSEGIRKTVQAKNRDQVLNDVGLHLQRPLSLIYSAQSGANSELLACICEEFPPSNCVAGAVNNPQAKDFTLFDPTASNRPLSGPPSAPLTYTSNGTPCEQGMGPEGCPIQVSTQFFAWCSGSGACNRADALEFEYTVARNPAAIDEQPMLSITKRVYVSVDELTDGKTGICLASACNITCDPDLEFLDPSTCECRPKDCTSAAACPSGVHGPAPFCICEADGDAYPVDPAKTWYCQKTKFSGLCGDFATKEECELYCSEDSACVNYGDTVKYIDPVTDACTRIQLQKDPSL